MKLFCKTFFITIQQTIRLEPLRDRELGKRMTWMNIGDRPMPLDKLRDKISQAMLDYLQY